MSNDAYEISPPTAPARRFGLTLILVFLCAALTAIGLSALGGYQAGVAEQRWSATETADIEADIQYSLGLNDLAQGRYALAVERFRYVLGVNPAYPGAAENLALAEASLSGGSPTPTLPPSNTEDPAELLAQAQEYFDAQEWEAAMVRLQELQSLAPDYQPAAVQEMRYSCLVNLGLLYVRGDRLEEGIVLLEQASEIRPLEDQVAGEQRLASLYLVGRDYWGINWDVVINNLSLVYAQAPTYRDVADRLREAHLRYAEAYIAQTEYCPAEQHYAEALQIATDDETHELWQAAHDACAEATPTPPAIGSVSVALPPGTPYTIPGFSGHLAYTYFDPERRFTTLFILDGTGTSTYMAAGGSQPDWRSDGSALAYHGYFGTAGLYVAEGAESYTPLVEGDTAYPTFSPDGSQIVYSQLDAEANVWRLYIISSACDQTAGGCQPESIGTGRAPIWGPGGALAYNGCGASGCGIFITTSGVGVETQLTTGFNDLPMSWSPDGQHIAYMSDSDGDWEVYTVDMGGNVAVLTSNSANDGLPAWSPDGGTIAFMTDRDGRWAIYLMNADGSNPRRILDLGPEHPNWANERLSWGP
jgi:tetratricopeptide (TPR) repeat protein